MRFSLNFVLLGAASVANAFISPGQLIRSIDDITKSTEALIKPAGQLSIADAPKLILGSGPFFDIITGLRDVTRLTTDVGRSLTGAAKGTFDGKDGDQIVASVKKLSNTFSDLLDAFLDKANIFGDFPIVGTPFRIAIALTKRAFNDFTGTIINTLSGSQANDARSSAQGVDGKFTRTITITEN
ncbi:hypothetical protein NCS57_00011900 [Fusarium keratoplasticum]|uniref:Uncharacterized protein n=1 Tax=Fusarium keratoplasticum TaxID=1328300 RepID=A0ACC0RBP2_9HYPO|nr:hypothetical protein NCS57_00011900 [Fusarium keratoplasticum]KAI8683477.1 hypothetical protein NCS57_00011900 [Fusarium keratoplasticum]KAI8687597.1 hypothetical protein NCS55_00011400 [Fusarium keratoplasticum]